MTFSYSFQLGSVATVSSTSNSGAPIETPINAITSPDGTLYLTSPDGLQIITQPI